MSVFDERPDLIDDMEFKYGRPLGRVAAAIDLLSDIQIAVGTHAAYCKRPSNPTLPTRDIEDVLRMVGHVKELLFDLRDHLKPRPA
jgi:hypothetical protein